MALVQLNLGAKGFGRFEALENAYQNAFKLGNLSGNGNHPWARAFRAGGPFTQCLFKKE